MIKRKSIALFLCAATIIQTSGISSRLVNGEAFVKANAAIEDVYDNFEDNYSQTIEEQTIDLIEDNVEQSTGSAVVSSFTTNTTYQGPEHLEYQIKKGNRITLNAIAQMDDGRTVNLTANPNVEIVYSDDDPEKSESAVIYLTANEFRDANGVKYKTASEYDYYTKFIVILTENYYNNRILDANFVKDSFKGASINMNIPVGTSEEEIRKELPKVVQAKVKDKNGNVKDILEEIRPEDWDIYEYTQAQNVGDTFRIGLAHQYESISYEFGYAISDRLCINAKLIEAGGKISLNFGNDSEKQKISSLTINGIDKVGNTLNAVVKDVDGNIVDSGLVYTWYALDYDTNDYFGGKIVSTAPSYNLTSNDNRKYIKLIVRDSYNNVLESENRYITKKSSSSHSSHSSSKSSSSTNSDSSKSESDSSSEVKTDTIVNTSASIENIKLDFADNGTVKLINADGQPATGWQAVNGSWYLGDANGNALTGWQMVNGSWYLMDNSGKMQTGWQMSGGKWYLLNSDGSMATGWNQVNGKWYLLNSNGAMETGWKQVNGKWYFMYSDGSMAANTTINGYKVDASGAWV